MGYKSRTLCICRKQEFISMAVVKKYGYQPRVLKGYSTRSQGNGLLHKAYGQGFIVSQLVCIKLIKIE